MDLRWRGGAEVFLLVANIYFKRIVLVKLWKYFCKDLLELGTGGVGVNLRPHRDFSHSILLNQIRGKRVHFDVPCVLPEGDVSLAKNETHI